MKYSEWKTYKLNQVGEVVSGGTPSTKIPQYWYGEIPWITPKDLSGYNKKVIYSGDRSISKEGLEKSSVRLIPKNSILFSSRAPIGYVAKAGVELGTNQGFKNLVVNKNHCHDFIYYLLINETENIKRISGGSTFSEISGTAFGNFKVKVPEKKIQKIIAKILSSLDDKIELNNKINNSLEELAQTLYKHWFVDFEFPNEEGLPYKSSGGKMVKSELGLIPDGWNKIKLDEYLEFERGVEPGSKNYKDTKSKNSLAFIRVGDLNKYNPVYVNKEHLKNKYMNLDDILVSFDGAIGRVSIGLEGSYSTGLRKIYSKNKINLPKEYQYYLFKSEEIQNTINNHANGTTILHASSSIKFLETVYNETIVEKFSKTVEPIFSKIIQIISENNKLEELRDLLLPKLMSGEIRVPTKE